MGWPEVRRIELRLPASTDRARRALFLAGARGRLAAVSGAAAFSFAGIFPFAAVIAGFTAAFAFTRVHSFAGVLVRFASHLLKGDAGFAGYIGGMSLHCKRTAD
jgi:hypothetical protein